MLSTEHEPVFAEQICFFKIFASLCSEQRIGIVDMVGNEEEETIFFFFTQGLCLANSENNLLKQTGRFHFCFFSCRSQIQRYYKWRRNRVAGKHVQRRKWLVKPKLDALSFNIAVWFSRHSRENSKLSSASKLTRLLKIQHFIHNLEVQIGFDFGGCSERITWNRNSVRFRV